VLLELRDHRITLHIGGEVTRYSVARKTGEVLATELTGEEMQVAEPALYQFVKSALVLAQSAMEPTTLATER
jgi:hypothetical protein